MISRKSRTSAACLARWDLDRVSSGGGWALEIGDPEPDYLEEFEEYVRDSGTMVCWDVIDRIGARTDLDKEGISPQALGSYMKYLREHLELTFHRFIGNGTLKILLNGEEVEPWDPFLPGESTQQLFTRSIKVQLPHSKVKEEVKLNAYVIPNKYEYSTAGAVSRARLSSRWQGFYVYREDRVIIAGDWLGMYAHEPHMTLLRLELTFPRELDEIFSLDIKKSTLNLNPALFRFIEKEVSPTRRVADKRYRQGQRKKNKAKTSPHDQSQALLNSKYEETTENLQTKQVNDNQVEITNADGTTVVSMPTVSTPDLRDIIQVVDSLPEGLLWEPAYVNNRLGIRLNSGHVYYDRVYLPNFDDSVTIRGIDSILWAMAKCEEEVMNKEVRKKLTDLRYSVSRTLRELAEELPEVPDTEE